MPARVGPALQVVLGGGLVAQCGAWFFTAGRGATLGTMALAAVVTALCFGLGAVWLRRAFAPLSPHAAQLQAIARMRETDPPPASPVPALHAAVDRLVADISALKRRMRAQLREGERLRQQAEYATAYKTGFLRSVRHELRTPLHAILGFSEVLLSELEGPLTGSQRENLVVIQRTARRLQDLFDEVIELATVAAGQLELQYEPIDAAALLEQVGEALEVERGDRPVHIRVEVAASVATCAGDPHRLKQLLRGMASHALSLCTGQLLVLSLGASGDGARLCVRDPTRKLSPNELEALLAQRSVASRRKGLDESSRLRVAIWQQLAQLYGGRFGVESDQRGTSYVLDVPSWRAS